MLLWLVSVLLSVYRLIHLKFDIVNKSGKNIFPNFFDVGQYSPVLPSETVNIDLLLNRFVQEEW